MAAKSFYETLTAAIAEMLDTGFDDPARVARLQEALREAAAATLGPLHSMDEMLRRAFQDVYRRMIERGGILKYHPGVARWTVEKLKPQLRLELDKRILASASLIKLQREEAIADTLRRFSGWATSIPPGGPAEADKRARKAEIRKPLARLPFEARRVSIDQGAKFLNSLNTIIANDQGALAGIWRSHHYQQNYRARPEHAARDGKFFTVRDNWAIRSGLMSKGPNGYTDEIEQPAEFVFCRCWYQFVYALRTLPPNMLTERGKIELARTRVSA